MFICGSRIFGHQDKNGSSPKKTRSKSVKKNPYEDGGVDKFLALVADLEEKKQKIYDEMGSENISFVRFVYSDESDQVRPIVVRAKKSKKKLSLNVKVEEKREVIYVKQQDQELLQVRMKAVINYYFGFVMMLVLILVFLAIYGRSFAILCTSIAWYLVPRIIVSSSSKGKVSH